MDSHNGSIRPYPSTFPQSPSPSSSGLTSPILRNTTNLIEQAPLLPLPAFLGDSRKLRTMQETTWVAPTNSQSARFPDSSILSPSFPSLPALSVADREWNDAKRRKFAHDYQQVSTSTHLVGNDTLTNSAISLASLSLSSFTTNIDSISLNSFNTPQNLSPSSISISPSTSPLSSSRSNTPLSSSSEVSSSPSPSPSPSSTPPSSPNVKQNRIEIRHKGKQLKSRCTCCHVCRTSLKNYPRNHLDCTACNAVVCQHCIEFRLSGPSWEVASKESNWLCPACLGTCVCQRCCARPLEIVTKTVPRKSENNIDARRQRLQELLAYHRERDKFINEIQNVLCIVKRDQREIECQIAALQNQGDEEDE